MQSVAAGGQRLRVAIRKGPNGPGQQPRVPLLLINGIGARLEALEPLGLGLLTEAAGLAPVVDGFLAGP